MFQVIFQRQPTITWTLMRLGRLTTKPTKWHVRPAKTQISLGIRPVWSESSQGAQWVAEDPMFLLADSEDWSDLAHAQADLSLRWAQRSFCKFCHEADQLFSQYRAKKGVAICKYQIWTLHIVSEEAMCATTEQRQNLIKFWENSVGHILNQILNAVPVTFSWIIQNQQNIDLCVCHSIFEFERSAWLHARAIAFCLMVSPFEKVTKKKAEITFSI